MFQPHKMSDFLILKKTGFHAKWRLKNESSNSILMMYKYNYPDLGSYTSSLWNFYSRFSKKKTNKQTNEQTKTRKKKQLKWKKKKNGKQVVTSRRFPLRLISTEHFMFYRMHLLTVAGEATARSWTSNNMCMVLLSLILSLLAKQSILLSSKTVFMFSIHRASTGPSHTIHLWSSVVSWGETIKSGHNKRQPEADVLHSWAVILNIYLGKSS